MIRGHQHVSMSECLCLCLSQKHLHQATSVRMEKPVITRWLIAWTQAPQICHLTQFHPHTITWVRNACVCLRTFLFVCLDLQTNVSAAYLPSGNSLFGLTHFCKRKPDDERSLCVPRSPCELLNRSRHHAAHSNINNNILGLFYQDGKAPGGLAGTQLVK